MLWQWEVVYVKFVSWPVFSSVEKHRVTPVTFLTVKTFFSHLLSLLQQVCKLGPMIPRHGCCHVSRFVMGGASGGEEQSSCLS